MTAPARVPLKADPKLFAAFAEDREKFPRKTRRYRSDKGLQQAPAACKGCGVGLRPRGCTAETAPSGTVRHQGRGFCTKCYRERQDTFEPLIDPNRPELFDCAGGCGRRLRRYYIPLAQAPGTVKERGRDRCTPCYNAQTAADDQAVAS